MIDANRKLVFSDRFRYIEANDEIIMMPLSDNISNQAYSFSDHVGKAIAYGIYTHLCLNNIVEMLLSKYMVERREVEHDVMEIILFLFEKEVVLYYE